MDIVTGNLGWIEAICGPMFSGKSEELMRRLRRAIIARKRVQVFKPVIDQRYSSDEIVSHNDLRMKSQAIQRASEILARRRPLTLQMIQKISAAWKISADLLVRPYRTTASAA